MQADYQAIASWQRLHQAASSVSNDETHTLPQTIGQYAAPLRSAGEGTVEIVLPARGNAALGDSGRIAGELEGKLQHASWG